jgi:hypothetical protein
MKRRALILSDLLRALAALQRSRRIAEAESDAPKKEWAERSLQIGFLRVPAAAEILGPIMAWKMARDPWSRRGRS